MSMIERVAKAIYDGQPTDTLTWEEVHHDSYLRAARDAIEAMREPTEAMKEAGYDTDHYRWSISASEAGQCWARMVDAVLEESAAKDAAPA